MAELESVLYTRLTGFAGLAALVGARVYPLELPQAPTYPAVSYARVSGEREHGMTEDHGMAHPRIQVDSWATSYAGCLAVARQVRLALQRWADAATDPAVLDSFLDNEIDTIEDVISGSEQRIFRRMQDYFIWYRE